MFMLLAAAATIAAPVQCEIVPQTVDAQQLLIGQCGKNAVMIGQAKSFESAANAATGSAVVVIRDPDATRVFLVSRGAAENALLEDITPDLARLGGRAPSSGLGDLSVDLSQFASDGSVLLTDASGKAQRSAGASPAFSASSHFAQEQALKALPQQRPPLPDAIAHVLEPTSQTASNEGQE